MEYYDVIASGYNELHYEEQLKKYEVIKRHLEIGKDERLLDVGCGTGLSSQIFPCRITGIDPSKEMLKSGKKSSTANEDCVQGKAEHLPFKNRAFDVVICVTAIHNFMEPRKALKEIKRVGKGKGAITVLKKAEKAEQIQNLIEEMFHIDEVIEEEKDSIIFFGIDHQL